MPTDHKRKTAPGEREVVILGTKLVVQFNDRTLLRTVLELAQGIDRLEDDRGAIELGMAALDAIDRCDDFFRDKFGQVTRDKLFGKGKQPMKEPLEAIRQLANEVGPAYDEMFASDK